MTDRPTVFCKDCKFSPNWFAGEYRRCRHTEAVRPINPVDGGRPPNQFCSSMRDTFGKCGPDGKLWEPRK